MCVCVCCLSSLRVTHKSQMVLRREDGGASMQERSSQKPHGFLRDKHASDGNIKGEFGMDAAAQRVGGPFVWLRPTVSPEKESAWAFLMW